MPNFVKISRHMQKTCAEFQNNILKTEMGAISIQFVYIDVRSPTFYRIFSKKIGTNALYLIKDVKNIF